MNDRSSRLALTMAVATVLTAVSVSSAADQAPGMHYEMPMPRAAFDSDLGKKAEGECNELFHLLLDREMLMDPQKRAACLQKARPILLQYAADYRALAVTYPSMQKASDGVQEETRQRLALLGDAEATQGLAADAGGADPDKAGTANALLMDNSWTMADGKAAQEADLAGQLEALDQKYPHSEALTNLTMRLSNEAATSALHERLVAAALGMDNPSAKKLDKLREIHEAAQRTAGLVGHPFAVAGRTPDGKPFTTADWKGKVVLVDFWATWCGPCKAELPGIKQLYADHHADGLEIVGVSNDFDPAALARFTPANGMPWPQLIDLDAAKRHTWNPITLNNGIDGIPRLFVIDRNGNLLSARAGEKYKELVEQALAQK